MRQAHVAAFPTVLRLLIRGPLLDELDAIARDGATIEKISFYRVLDNAPIELSGDELWTQLNFQLIHALDFLPALAWKVSPQPHPSPSPSPSPRRSPSSSPQPNPTHRPLPSDRQSPQTLPLAFGSSIPTFNPSPHNPSPRDHFCPESIHQPHRLCPRRRQPRTPTTFSTSSAGCMPSSRRPRSCR